MMMEHATGVQNFDVSTSTGVNLPTCFWLSVESTEYTTMAPTTTTTNAADTTTPTTAAPTTASPTTASPTTASPTTAPTTAAPTTASTDKPGRRAPYAGTLVKVDHCLCTTDTEDADASPCNADDAEGNNCFTNNGCMACPGGDLSDPDADQFCQRKEVDYCMEDNHTCSGAAGVNFGIAATAASFIASRIFA